MSAVPKLVPRAADAELSKLLAEGQTRHLRNLLAVASDAWIRNYLRANPHKTFDALKSLMPSVMVGAGENGEHVFKVIHAVPRSSLDEVEVIEGHVVKIPEVPFREPTDL